MSPGQRARRSRKRRKLGRTRVARRAGPRAIVAKTARVTMLVDGKPVEFWSAESFQGIDRSVDPKGYSATFEVWPPRCTDPPIYFTTDHDHQDPWDFAAMFAAIAAAPQPEPVAYVHPSMFAQLPPPLPRSAFARATALREALRDLR